MIFLKIGIITRTDLIDQKSRVFINESYIKKIIDFGNTPILLYGYEDTSEIASYCDALIIPGGYDIAPFYFDDVYDSTCTFYKDATQDSRDFKIIDAFVKKQKPILGICRGLQLINVYFKGTLHQHIDIRKHEQQHEHTISISSNSFLNTCIPSNCNVNSYHHQAIATLGNHLQISATSYDGYIEAIQHETLPIIAVQWHPELISNDFIFPYFFHRLMNFLS